MLRIISVLALVFILGSFVYAEKYKTTVRGYFSLTNGSLVVKNQFDVRALELAFIFNNFGLGTKGIRFYNNGTFDEDSIEMAAFIAPAYIYYVPFGSHRKTGDITPMIMQFYAGFSAWGFQRGMLIDIGVGFTYYLFSLRFGYNAIRADSRIFFNVEDEGFPDWQINRQGFYLAIDLFPGFWISLKSKSEEKQGINH